MVTLVFVDFGASARTLPNGRVLTSSEQRMRFMEPYPSPAECKHGIDRQDSGLHRLGHQIPFHDRWGGGIDRLVGLGLDRGAAVQRAAQRIDDTAQQAASDGYAHDRPVACTSSPASIAPMEGELEVAGVRFDAGRMLLFRAKNRVSLRGAVDQASGDRCRRAEFLGGLQLGCDQAGVRRGKDQRVATDSGCRLGSEAAADAWLKQPEPAMGGMAPRIYAMTRSDCLALAKPLLAALKTRREEGPPVQA
jgi:hypothetical protein